MADRPRFYLTTAIDYPNSRPHIGTAFEKIGADVQARYRRQQGYRVFYLMGNDENTTKVSKKAAELGKETKAYCDDMARQFREVWDALDISYDVFIQTSSPRHHACCRKFIQKVYDNGYIKKGTFEGWYCPGCEAFKSEDELVDGKCPDHGIEPEWIEEKNWFFRLSSFQQPLLDLYDARPDFVLPRFRYNEARSFIEHGLQDFSLSRAGQPWGVPIPWDPDQVVYVWVDALINYLSALTYARPGEDLRDRYWPEVRHLIGKDILRFHCVFWPALLLAAGYDPPKQLFVHGFLQIGERKISKSVGNVISPLDLLDIYGVDPVRFYVARVTTFGQDGNASVEDVHERYERELANDLGNLVSRTTAMIARYRDGTLKPADGSPPVDLARLRDDVAERLDAWDLSGGLEAIWSVIRDLNRYVESSAPWQLAKDEAKAAELDVVLYNLADGLTGVAIALAPYLPETAPQILDALGQSHDLAWSRIARGVAEETEGIEAAAPLFPRVDLPAAAA